MATSWILLVLAAVFSQVLAAEDFCLDYIPRDPEAVSLQTVLIEDNHAKQDGVMPQSREVNVHDAWDGCSDLQDTDLLEVFFLCFPPVDSDFHAVMVHINAAPGGLFRCVRVLDRAEDGTGAVPRIMSGGAGHDFVNYTLTGQMSQGVKHITQVFWRSGTDFTTEVPTTDGPGGAGALTGPRGLVAGALLLAMMTLRAFL